MAKNKVPHIDYGNVLHAAPIQFPKGFKQSQTQHVRLMKTSPDPVKRLYHREVLNEQNLERRLLTKPEKKELYRKAVINDKRR